MRIRETEKRKHIILDPGEYYVSDENVILTTLLGSCVAACLYDPIERVVGMNHFLLGTGGYDGDVPVCETEPGKYGMCAMERLVDMMLKSGAQYQNLHAKVFGGGSMFKPFAECRISSFCVGSLNILFIQEFFRKSGIKQVAEDMGGDHGRVIHFFSDTFSVYVRKVAKQEKLSGIIKQDRRLWEKVRSEK